MEKDNNANKVQLVKDTLIDIIGELRHGDLDPLAIEQRLVDSVYTLDEVA